MIFISLHNIRVRAEIFKRNRFWYAIKTDSCFYFTSLRSLVLRCDFKYMPFILHALSHAILCVQFLQPRDVQSSLLTFHRPVPPFPLAEKCETSVPQIIDSINSLVTPPGVIQRAPVCDSPPTLISNFVSSEIVIRLTIRNAHSVNETRDS